MNPEHFIHQLEETHRNAIIFWQQNPIESTQQGVFKLVEENHAFNYQLWNTEDKARRDDMGFEYVYRAKRDIDHYNQQRNNRMEMMDEWFYHQLQPSPAAQSKIHSETPGMMIDRLSILALKQYHMALQLTRQDVNDQHRQSCQHKLLILNEQQQRLLHCLKFFLQDILDKKRTFVIYHQFKMYNDPTLNPELYDVAHADGGK